MNMWHVTLRRKVGQKVSERSRLNSNERCKRVAMLAVVANKKQAEAIDDLWFRYGNMGSNHRDEDHIFLQRLVEGRNRHALEGPEPSEECIKACEEILCQNAEAWREDRRKTSNDKENAK